MDCPVCKNVSLVMSERQAMVRVSGTSRASLKRQTPGERELLVGAVAVVGTVMTAPESLRDGRTRKRVMVPTARRHRVRPRHRASWVARSGP